jgi:DNA (cytosine-5)-methyltransferase 1
VDDAQPLHVLDLFCGMGGLSIGFKEAGFSVEGIDFDQRCVDTYLANVGQATKLNLSTELPRSQPAILLAGPPCRPWSRLNVTTQRGRHRDHGLIDAVRRGLAQYKPRFFIMENVPLLAKDAIFGQLRRSAKRLGYATEARVLSYADFGAATLRRRLFLFGAKRSVLDSFLQALTAMQTPSSSVEVAIRRYIHLEAQEVPDHEWGLYETLEKYAPKYESGKYGWFRLEWDQPAPSFGSIYKTYTLHPDWQNGHHRVLSVREAMAIMGFEDTFVFPQQIARTHKYRMVADSVSPTFSKLCAKAIGYALHV